jgi:hypothetical protein
MGRYLEKARQVTDSLSLHNGLLNRDKEYIEKRLEKPSLESEGAAKEAKNAKEVLDASRTRLEALGINIAVWNDGTMRIVVTEDDTLSAIHDGGTIYSPEDMLHYVELEPGERRLLHRFKKQFGGSAEWKDHASG